MRAGQRPSIPAVPKRVEDPQPGRWLFTCRAGFEPQLFEELQSISGDARLLGNGWVEAPRARLAPAFARFGFEVLAVLTEPAAALRFVENAGPVHLQAWPADTDDGNRLTARATALRDALTPALAAKGNSVPDAWTAHRDGRALLQLCPLDETRFVVGVVPSSEALSLSPGGRHRMPRGDGPSRAAMKLEEALSWLRLEPGRGELCVDLGAAPGGWTQAVLARGARVWAVDPGSLTPELMRQKKVTHFRQSAFAFEPNETADWLLCDMAWRPLEVAQLLGKWARRGWATMLVANLKLPMKDKLPMIDRCRGVLEEGGWKDVRVRQLYHDRDEVTVTART